MSDLNVTVMSGRLVRNPIVRNNGSRVSFFTIAANRHYQDKAEVWQEETAFLACKSFGWWADVVARHGTGDMALVEGRLRTESWSDQGATRSQLVLVCDSVRFISITPQSGGDPQANGLPPRFELDPSPAGTDAAAVTDGGPPF